MILLVSITFMHAAAVIINSSSTTLQILNLKSSTYDVNINNQIAVVTLHETFKNTFNSNVAPRFYYPLPEGASATQLRWFSQGLWWQANISPNPSTTPGGPTSFPSYFTNYVGSMPVTFDFTTVLYPADTLAVELTYVQLLPYKNGVVDLNLTNNYIAIQSASLQSQSLNVDITSTRQITSLSLVTPSNGITEFTNNHGSCHYAVNNASANTNYHMQYSLALNELGLWSFSTEMDSVPDFYGNGFFTFIVEPDPSNNTQVINKVFTLMIDRSGSMSGTKMEQAKSAATYIVNHLNEGDYFNIISFNEASSDIWTEHHNTQPANISTALNYISGLYASGMTDIGAAFGMAVPQFSSSAENTANIIIFLTDGCPTAGLTDTQQLRNYINQLIDNSGHPIYLFNFGIGSDVNTQLLTLTGADNSGLSTFLGQNDVYATITDFYNKIRNPVLLDPVLTATPNNALQEMYPNPLPNLYLGSQMIISGRYTTPQVVHLTFSGHSFNQQVSYQYDMNLTGDNDPTNQFLTKIWAKQKIDYLLVQYYGMDTTSTTAHEIKQTIINISMMWGVITPFTSFHSGSVPNVDETLPVPTSNSVTLLGNYPNPFNPTTYIKFSINSDQHLPVYIRIYNIRGQLIKVLGIKAHGKGMYQVMWDGTDQQNKKVSSGVYFYNLEFGDVIQTGKMVLMK